MSSKSLNYFTLSFYSIINVLIGTLFSLLKCAVGSYYTRGLIFACAETKQF